MEKINIERIRDGRKAMAWMLIKHIASCCRVDGEPSAQEAYSKWLIEENSRTDEDILKISTNIKLKEDLF